MTDADPARTSARPWASVLVRSASDTFPPTVAAPRQVRRFVGETIRTWGFGNLCGTAELLVSEIVTNVVLHARTEGRVAAIALPTGVRIEITDRGDDLPQPQDPGHHEPEGRGLGIVAALARRWGVRVEDDRRKTVWFELDDDPDPRDAGT